MAVKSPKNQIMLDLKNSLRQTQRLFVNISNRHLFLIGSSLIILILGFQLSVTILSNVLLFEGFAADGAFQLMNPLRRLAAGEAIGNDFNFFHGIGVPLLHLPLYYLFGQGFIASEFTRWLMSPALFFLSTYLFFYVFRRRWVFAVPMTLIVITISMLIIPFLVLPLTSLLGVRSTVPVFLLMLILSRQKWDRPLRNTPLLSKITWYELMAAILLVLSFICGTEFGVAALLAFFISQIFFPTVMRQKWRDRGVNALRIASLFAVILLTLLTIITRGAPLEPLRYALSEVPADQFWYFGVPPNNFLYLDNIWQSFMNDSRVLIMWGIAIVAMGLALAAYRRTKNRIFGQASVYGFFAGAFAMVSMLGYYHNSEASSLARMSLLIGFASAVLLWERWKKPVSISFIIGSFKKRFRLQPNNVLRLLAALMIVGSIGYGVYAFHDIKKEYDVIRVARKAKNFVLGNNTDPLGDEWMGVDNLVVPLIQADNNVPIVDVNDANFEHGISKGEPQVIVDAGDKASFLRPGQIVYFTKTGRQIVKDTEKRGNSQLVVTLQDKYIRLDPQHDGAPGKLIVAEDFKHDNSKVWSVYSGLIEQELGIFNASHEGYDYIIHALDKERRKQYIDDFREQKPQYVLTFNRTYFRYEEWLQNAHWDFYSLLNQNYKVALQTPMYVVWKKDATWSDAYQQNQTWQPLEVDAPAHKISLPALSFDKVPDLEDYGEQEVRKEKARKQALGIEVKDEQSLTLDEYSRKRVEEENRNREQIIVERENSGNETDVAEHQIWLKAVKDAQEASKDKTNKAGGIVLHEPRPKRQVILVKLKYEVSHSLSAVPLFGKTMRYLVEANNVYSRTPVTLRPYANEVTFPLVISEKNHDSYLRLKTYSILPGEGTIKIIDAQWAPLETSIEGLKVFTD